MTEKNIEQVFKDALDHFEADVNPNVWSNIEQGLNAPVSGNPVSGSSSAVKSAGILGKMGIKGLALVSAAAITVVGTVIYFVTEKTTPKIEPPVISSPIENTVSPVPQNQTETIVKNIEPAAEQKNDADKKILAPVTKQQQAFAETKSVAEQPHNSEKSDKILNPPATASSQQPKSTNQKENTAKTDPVSSPKTTDDHEKTEPDKPVQQNPETNKEKIQDGFDLIENHLVPNDEGTQKLPNVFTPDGDGYNDDFRIKTVNLKTLEVIIFDRKERVVYSWKSINGAWDGKLADGSEASAGDYFYSLKAETVEGKICIAQSQLKLIREK